MKRLLYTGRSFKASGEASGTPWRYDFLIAFMLLGAVITAIYEGAQAALQRQKVLQLSVQIDQLQRDRDQSAQSLADPSRTALRLSAPPQAGASLNAPTNNLYARFKDPPKLSPEQIDTYLKAYGRKAFSLLAAYRTSGDATLLREAMEKYPDDSQVAFEAIFAADLSPEQRRQWLNAFEQNAPDNSLANYLSARDYLKTGQTDQALQELLTASGKHEFQDYTLSRRQDNEEAFLAAGYSTAEAKLIGSSQLELPQLAQLKELGVQMVDLAKSYRNSGDDASAQALLQMAVGLGQSYSAGDCAISHLVGLAIERIALGAMDPNSQVGNSGISAHEQLAQLTQQKTSIAQLFKDNESLLQSLSDQDWINYIDRDKSFGEEAALRWVVDKYGQK